MRKEHRQLTRAELAQITSSRSVVRKVRREEPSTRPDAALSGSCGLRHKKGAPGPDATPESIRVEQEEYDQEVAKIREGTP